DISRTCELTRTLVVPDQIWCKSTNLEPGPGQGASFGHTPDNANSLPPGTYAPEREQIAIEQTPYSEFTSQSLQFGIQGQGTLYAHARDMNIGTAQIYGDPYPLKCNSMCLTLEMNSLVEEPSTTVSSRSDPFTSSGGLATAFPVFSNVTSMNCPPAGSGIKQLPFDWSTSEATANGAAVYLGQTSLKDMMVVPDINDRKRCGHPQQVHNSPIKGHDDCPSTAEFDLSQVWTFEPSSRAAEMQASDLVFRSGNRYICGICFKSHTRPSRAMACENGHLGFQPFVCDGTCGDPVW
ncbi:hypothetical protein FS842_011231, partial [Serendipita sp. 407]